MKGRKQLRIFFPALLIFAACKTQPPAEPRYVDYVPYFDQTRKVYLKSPSPKGVKLDTLVCIWSNLREEKYEYTDTLVFDQTLDMNYGQLIVDLELINEKPPRLDTFLLIEDIFLTRKMIDTYFPLIPDSMREELLFPVEQIFSDSLTGPENVVRDSLFFPDSTLIQPADTSELKNSASIQDEMIPEKIETPKEWFSREEALSDTLRDLLDANSIIDNLLNELDFGVNDTVPFRADSSSFFLDSMVYVVMKTIVVEVRDSSGMVKQRPLHELSREMSDSVVFTDTIVCFSKLSYKVYHKEEQDIFIDMVRVKGGNFQIGSNEFDEDERPAYSINVSDYLFGKYEVTNFLYASFLSIIGCDSIGDWDGIKLIDLRSPYTKIKKSLYSNRFDVETGYHDFPVVNVTWEGARLFCNVLGSGRLPTEAEWEFASKGGIYARRFLIDGRTGNYDYAYRFAGSNNLRGIAWFVDNSGGFCRRVGTKHPNELGIHDINGNVWEWCHDKYDKEFYKTNGDSYDPVCLTGRGIRVNRGGGWSSDAQYCRNANRNFLEQQGCNQYLGFRYVQGTK